VKAFKEAKVFRDAADRWWIDQFRAHAVNPYIKTLALFMWVTAARIGECMIMRPDHLELDQKRARLDKTKTDDPRIYYLTDELVRELRLLPPRRVDYGRGELRVFGYSDHHGVRVPWKTTCERAGIPHLTPHEAGRHGFGTEMLVRQKQDPVTTAALGGWADPVVLMKRYAHAEKLAQVAEESFGAESTKLAHARIRRTKRLSKQ
jgi:integrase